MGLYTLPGAMLVDRATGEPFPTVWKELDRIPVRPRKGRLWLVAAAPGVGKSVFALTWAIRSGAKTLYNSADSDSRDQLGRSVSMLQDWPLNEVLDEIDAGEYFQTLMETRANHIRFDFDSSPTLEGIDAGMTSWAYLHGRYPEALIVDNLMNVVADEAVGDGAHKTQQDILLFLLSLARTTGTFVMVLHHLTGEYEDGTKVPTLGGLLGKAGKVPQVVLGLYRDTTFAEERLGVAVLKNREGPASAAGRLVTTLEMDLSRMRIVDPQPWRPG